MSYQKGILLIVLFAVTAGRIAAQNRQGGSQGFNMAQIIETEKKAVVERITSLNDDQKEVINIIYADYAKAFGKVREEAAGDFQAMRNKMASIREEKEESMKDLLTETQFKEYSALMAEIRQSRSRGN